MVLQQDFPSFNIAVDKEELVSSVLQHTAGNVVTWNPSFRRNRQDWELDPLQRFIELLYAQKV